MKMILRAQGQLVSNTIPGDSSTLAIDPKTRMPIRHSRVGGLSSSKTNGYIRTKVIGREISTTGRNDDEVSTISTEKK